MARDHARISIDIWDDDAWRDVSPIAQWLYLHLDSCRSLTFAGVADWRPARIAQHATGMTARVVEAAGAELQAGEFVLIDADSEEVMLRSWVKHDGLLRSPNMAKALARDHGTIASPVLRAVLVGQLVALKRKYPDLKGWPEVAPVLRKRSMKFADGVAALAPEGSGEGSDQPSGEGMPAGSRTPFLLSSLPPFLPNSTSSSSPFVTRGSA